MSDDIIAGINAYQEPADGGGDDIVAGINAYQEAAPAAPQQKRFDLGAQFNTWLQDQPIARDFQQAVIDESQQPGTGAMGWLKSTALGIPGAATKAIDTASNAARFADQFAPMTDWALGAPVGLARTATGMIPNVDPLLRNQAPYKGAYDTAATVEQMAMPGAVGKNVLQSGVIGGAMAGAQNVSDQYRETGKVDPLKALTATGIGTVLAGGLHKLFDLPSMLKGNAAAKEAAAAANQARAAKVQERLAQREASKQQLQAVQETFPGLVNINKAGKPTAVEPDLAKARSAANKLNDEMDRQRRDALNKLFNRQNKAELGAESAAKTAERRAEKQRQVAANQAEKQATANAKQAEAAARKTRNAAEKARNQLNAMFERGIARANKVAGRKLRQQAKQAAHESSDAGRLAAEKQEFPQAFKPIEVDGKQIKAQKIADPMLKHLRDRSNDSATIDTINAELARRNARIQQGAANASPDKIDIHPESANAMPNADTPAVAVQNAANAETPAQVEKAVKQLAQQLDNGFTLGRPRAENGIDAMAMPNPGPYVDHANAVFREQLADAELDNIGRALFAKPEYQNQTVVKVGNVYFRNNARRAGLGEHDVGFTKQGRAEFDAYKAGLPEKTGAPIGQPDYTRATLSESPRSIAPKYSADTPDAELAARADQILNELTGIRQTINGTKTTLGTKAKMEAAHMADGHQTVNHTVAHDDNGDPIQLMMERVSGWESNAWGAEQAQYAQGIRDKIAQMLGLGTAYPREGVKVSHRALKAGVLAGATALQQIFSSTKAHAAEIGQVFSVDGLWQHMGQWAPEFSGMTAALAAAPHLIRRFMASENDHMLTLASITMNTHDRIRRLQGYVPGMLLQQRLHRTGNILRAKMGVEIDAELADRGLMELRDGVVSTDHAADCTQGAFAEMTEDQAKAVLTAYDQQRHLLRETREYNEQVTQAIDLANAVLRGDIDNTGIGALEQLAADAVDNGHTGTLAQRAYDALLDPSRQQDLARAVNVATRLRKSVGFMEKKLGQTEHRGDADCIFGALEKNFMRAKFGNRNYMFQFLNFGDGYMLGAPHVGLVEYNLARADLHLDQEMGQLLANHNFVGNARSNVAESSAQLALDKPNAIAGAIDTAGNAIGKAFELLPAVDTDSYNTATYALAAAYSFFNKNKALLAEHGYTNAKDFAKSMFRMDHDPDSIIHANAWDELVEGMAATHGVDPLHITTHWLGESQIGRWVKFLNQPARDARLQVQYLANGQYGKLGARVAMGALVGGSAGAIPAEMQFLGDFIDSEKMAQVRQTLDMLEVARWANPNKTLGPKVQNGLITYVLNGSENPVVDFLQNAGDLFTRASAWTNMASFATGGKEGLVDTAIKGYKGVSEILNTSENSPGGKYKVVATDPMNKTRIAGTKEIDINNDPISQGIHVLNRMFAPGVFTEQYKYQQKTNQDFFRRLPWQKDKRNVWDDTKTETDQ